jgi:formylglycine-generating enzyme required for sulfatase activity
MRFAWAILALAVGLCPAYAQSPIPKDPSQSVPGPTVRPLAPTPSPERQAAPAGSGFPVPVGQGFRDCPECPEMMVIPSGSFRMGSPAGEAGRDPDEGPQRQVTVRAPLAVGRHAVTVGQYRAFAQATGRGDGGSCFVWTGSRWENRQGLGWRNPGFGQGDEHPVVCVSWEDAQAYARWLSQRTGHRYRLLTEAEWEYAARAGTTTRWWWGENEAQQCRHANGADQTARAQVSGASGWAVAPCTDGFAHTAPVGRFLANRFGLHDMGGNAWQWVEDCYRDSYAGAPSDASQAVTTGDCASRVLRGGSWNDSPQLLRSAFRDRLTPGGRYDNYGFRVARTPGG